MFEKFEDFNIHLCLDAVWDDTPDSDFLLLHIAQWKNDKICICQRFLYILYNQPAMNMMEFLCDKKILLQLMQLEDNAKIDLCIDKVTKKVVY